jgi:hypothetical protein
MWWRIRTNYKTPNNVMAGLVPATHNLSFTVGTLEYGWPPRGRP